MECDEFDIEFQGPPHARMENEVLFLQLRLGIVGTKPLTKGAWKLWVQEYLFQATIVFSNTTCTHLSNLELLWTVFWLHYRFLSFCTGIAVINLLNVLIILYYCMYCVYNIVKLLQIKKKFPLLVHMTIDLSCVKYREFSARVGWRIKVGE